MLLLRKSYNYQIFFQSIFLILDITFSFPINAFIAVLPSKTRIFGFMISMCFIMKGKYLPISSSVGLLFSGGR